MNFERVAMGVVFVAALTAVSLPDRKFAQVLAAGGQAVRGVLGTAITGKV